MATLRFPTRALMAAILTFMLVGTNPASTNDTIRIIVGGVEKQIYLPVKLAEQLGYFRSEGLNVEILSEPDGGSAQDQLLAGAAEAVVGFYDHAIDLQAKGAFVESVVQLSRAPGEVVIVASRKAHAMRSPADWKGSTLGVTGLGSSTNFLIDSIAAKNGVKVREVTVLPVGSGNTFLAALRDGRIDGGITADPTASRVVKTGLGKILIDLRRPEQMHKVFGGMYPAAAVYMKTGYVESHRDLTQRLVKAFVKALRYIDTHSAENIAEKVPSDYYAGDKAMYVEALAQGKAMFTNDGVMPKGGPETVYRVLAAFDTRLKGRAIDLPRTYTTAFVDVARNMGKRTSTTKPLPSLRSRNSTCAPCDSAISLTIASPKPLPSVRPSRTPRTR